MKYKPCSAGAEETRQSRRLPKSMCGAARGDEKGKLSWQKRRLKLLKLDTLTPSIGFLVSIGVCIYICISSRYYMCVYIVRGGDGFGCVAGNLKGHLELETQIPYKSR